MYKYARLHAVMCIFVMASAQQAGAELVLHYTFDETSGDTVNAVDSGASPAAPGIFAGGATRVANTPGGFSARALDLTANGAVDNYVTTGTDVDKLDGLSELTATMWVNLQGDPSRGDRLLSDQPAFPPLPPAGEGGWNWRFDDVSDDPLSADSFRMNFEWYRSFGNTAQGSGYTSQTTLNGAGRWVFLAATFNGNFGDMFAGDETSSPIFIGGVGGASFGLQDNSVEFLVGESLASGDQTPPAWIDDVRIYDEILTIGQLDAIRMANLPEPNSLGLLALGSIITLERRRRKNQWHE
jgi:hypothetical protein